MSNDIIKFLGFEDSNIEIIDSIYRSNQRIITLQKRLFKHYYPICSHIMHSKGIYTRTINHHLHKYLLKLIRKYRDIDELRHYELEQRLGRKVEFTSSREYYLLKKIRMDNIEKQ